MKAPLSNLNVLVCEYKPSNRTVIRAILEKEGHTVTVAPSLLEALAVFSANPKDTFDLIIADVIPAENRMQWVKAVRKVQPQIMLLAISAYLGDGFLPPDCGLYLPKPFTSQVLISAIAELIATPCPVPVVPVRRAKRRRAA